MPNRYIIEGELVNIPQKGEGNMKLKLITLALLLGCGTEEKTSKPENQNQKTTEQPAQIFVAGVEFEWDVALTVRTRVNVGNEFHFIGITWNYGDTAPDRCTKENITTSTFDTVGNRSFTDLGSDFYTGDELALRICIGDVWGNFSEGLVKNYTIPYSILNKYRPKSSEVTGVNFDSIIYQGDVRLSMDVSASETKGKIDQKVVVSWDYGDTAPDQCDSNAIPSDTSTILGKARIVADEVFNEGDILAMRFCVLYADGTYSEGIVKNYTVPTKE